MSQIQPDNLVNTALIEMGKALSNKVDRIEFSSIISNKANSIELQKLIQEILKAKGFEDFQKNERM